jgi:response regulator RpfG family c-di-GMP phosphodiesterase
LPQDQIATDKTEAYAFPVALEAGGLEEPDDIKSDGRTAELKGAPLILIVEDNAEMLVHIRSGLKENYRIAEAQDGVLGLAAALKEIPDLVISDVMMPAMDGFEFCARLKGNEKTCHIPVILLTARAAGEDKIAGLETGADDYIAKPFSMQELQVRVKNLIEQRRKLRALFRKKIDVQPGEVTVTSMDEQFLQRAMAIIEAHIDDSAFGVDGFSKEMAMSRQHLNRKMQALTDLSARDFIRTFRLKRAAQLLEKKSATVLEIAYAVGFTNPSYFSDCFRDLFGKLPSEYGETVS